MKITALEEHLATPGLMRAWTSAPGGRQDGYATMLAMGRISDQLLDHGAGRIADMDDQGIDVQVLSVTTPGTHNLPAERAVPLAREANDAIAAAIAAYPGRFEGFATLPTPAPQQAAAELRRAISELGFMGAMIHGRTGDKNVDHPSYEPLWAAAADLRSPIYIHPQLPPDPVRRAYYDGLPPFASFAMSAPAPGWHYETGVQLLRLIFGGVFDRHPDLQVIVGHWGELVLFYIERIEDIQDMGDLGARRPVLEYFRENISITGSGSLSDRYLAWTTDLVGTGRILYSTDYPFIDTSKNRARQFLEQADLTDTEKEAIAHGNWERLTAHLR